MMGSSLCARETRRSRLSKPGAWSMGSRRPSITACASTTTSLVPASVSTPEMIQKTTESWELSDNLGMEGGVFRVAGTRYHALDTYAEMMRRQVMHPRVYPATDDGTETGSPVLMSKATLADKRRVQGPYTFHTQMLLNPKGDETQGFRREWIAWLQGRIHSESLNRYILCDPASEKKRSSDWTCFWVVGVGKDKNYVILDCVRDRLNLSERADTLFALHEKWQPDAVGYERYGLQADIQHIEFLQAQRNYRFRITEVGGQTPKIDRIKRLVPVFEQGRIFLPRSIHRTMYDGTNKNLIDIFVEEELLQFPVSAHDDMLDALARILDPDFVPHVRWPKSDLPGSRRHKDLPRYCVGLGGGSGDGHHARSWSQDRSGDAGDRVRSWSRNR
jgi:predicted phage terminase large subunit-like protein